MISFNGSSARSSYALPVLKVQPSRSAFVTMCSEDLVIINTHWLGRRLWCADEDCPGCEVSPLRSVVYFVAVADLPGGMKPYLVETTPNEINRLSSLCQMSGHKLESGLVIECRKKSKRSPMRFEPLDSGHPVPSEYKPVRRTLAAAAVLGGVPLPAAEASLTDYLAKIRPAILHSLRKAISEQR
jgi:hypothetical protein